MSEERGSPVSGGPIVARLVDAELRGIDVLGWGALDAVYVTVRDADWQAVPGMVSDVRTTAQEDRSLTEFTVWHRAGEVDFAWRGAVEAGPGRVRFSMDGKVGNDFRANRIGFALLHPQRLRGRGVSVAGPKGTVAGVFPVAVSPHQPYLDVQSLRCDISDGVALDILLEGDLFEMEDHRNWSDPGWKTYCTPLALPAPVLHREGERIRQSVELRAEVSPGAAARPTRRPGTPVELRVEATRIGEVPRVGMGASGLPVLNSAALRAVRALQPAYLHVDLEAYSGWRETFGRALMEAQQLQLPLDVALVATPEELPELAGALIEADQRPGRAPGTMWLQRVALFSPDRHTTDVGTVAAVRAALAAAGLSPAVGGGSRAHLAELNRGTFDAENWDFCTYGVTPQVHHTDDASLLGTTSALADGLERARAIGRGLPVVVGPISLRPRFNATSGRPEPLPDPAADGPDVDPRLATGLATGYLAGALAGLVGTAAVTAFRTIGPRGVVAADGSLRPVAHLAAAIARRSGRDVLRSSADDPSVLTLAVAGDGRGLDVLVVNLAAHSQAVRLSGAALRSACVVGGAALHAEPMELPGRSVGLLNASTLDSGAAA